MGYALRRLLLPLMATLLLAGCAGQSFMPGTGGQSAQELLNQANNQSGQQAAASRLQAADILARQGDTAQALQIAGQIDTSQLDATQQVKWALVLSDAGIAEKDGWSVIRATDILDTNAALSSDDGQTLRYRRGIALNMVGEPEASARLLIGLQQNNAPYDLNDDIWKPLSSLSPTALDSLAAADDSAIMQGWVDLARLYRASGGDIGNLFDRLDQWRSRYPDHPANRRLPSDLTALRQIEGNEIHQIAVFLPQSGPLSNIAAAIRNGLETRAEDAKSQGENTPSLTFVDSSNQDIDALYAQATMSGAQAVIGPLDKEKVSQLETRASVPLPTLALNYGEHARNSATNLYQYGLSAEDEARQAAHRAHLDGHRRAGIMVPDNDWGSRVLAAFRQRWESEGGQVASVESYNPSESVAPAVRNLLNSDPSSMDMLFLLALPSYARQVPPTLDFYYAADLPIYATSHLYAGTPEPRADHDLNDVQFVDIPWMIPDAAAGGVDALPFVSTYRRLVTQDDPGLLKLNAMGVDAYELARRLPLFQALPNTQIFGATGTLSARDDGRIQRTLPWAVFESGTPQPLLSGPATSGTQTTAAPSTQGGTDDSSSSRASSNGGEQLNGFALDSDNGDDSD
ncbi:penicillin-binding protein activator [Salinicola rhizosphaerae]|uniref:Penicillin-binding protein activator n=1 Tax=Salinicola rhizosphaerae TaxID=1443141 RepID=A0ABQ3EFT0_9GAMM|nr:penicillin-binding protein activator [Salinicola rhizosphaerae]GHB31030.1 penicillin-binding protein activator [Salinicola rhizosphaerae]